MAFADDPDVAGGMEDAQTASFEVMIYAAELAQKQRQGFTGPVIQALLEGEIDGQPITDEMFSWVFILLMVGGNESTRTAIAHGLPRPCDAMSCTCKPIRRCVAGVR